MLATLIIVFREVIEAGLIVGIVLAATRDIPHRGGFITGGIAAGIAGAALLALFAGALSSAVQGRGQEVFTACILIVATLMLGWHNLWMASHGREMAQEMRAMGNAVASGDKSLVAVQGRTVADDVARTGSTIFGCAAGNSGCADASSVRGLEDVRLDEPCRIS